ncbi:hypothetical protein SAMN04488511_102273 [Pedobacter suwonensis]|uniref:Uncharacterized protein n=1 Tax=Pedobacter suwonensis TaxID=332999 RepID=A0A1I0SP38_9SPHI|nr:hypothetical protein SAMN04488511_102273 [Pedobacter suwonensis]
MRKISILLFGMIFLSLFVGIPINHNWSFVFQYEFIDFPMMLRLYDVSNREIISWIVVLLSHVGIISLPFFLKRVYFRKMLFYFPFFFLIGFLMLRMEFLFLLLPFLIVWLITLRTEKKIRN